MIHKIKEAGLYYRGINFCWDFKHQYFMVAWAWGEPGQGMAIEKIALRLSTRLGKRMKNPPI